MRLEKAEQNTIERRSEVPAAAGLEKLAAIKEYTRLLVERAGQSSKVRESFCTITRDIIS